MNKKSITILLLAISLTSSVCAQTWEDTGNWGIYDKKPDVTFKPFDDKLYKKHFVESAKYFIAIFNMNDRVNDFCLIGYKWNDNNRENKVNVIWKDNYLINWEMPLYSVDDLTYTHSLVMSKPSINLKDNVVPYSEIGFHTALWPEEGVKQITEDCLKNGNQVQIKPFKPDSSWNSDKNIN